MKKLIAVAMMLFAFTLTANAQQAKQTTKQDAAKKDVAALVSKITIDQKLKDDMYTLMVMKYDLLATAKTPAEKAKVSETIEHKIMSGVSKEQGKALTNDPALLKQLTH